LVIKEGKEINAKGAKSFLLTNHVASRACERQSFLLVFSFFFSLRPFFSFALFALKAFSLGR